jgi:hypothetical protein
MQSADLIKSATSILESSGQPHPAVHCGFTPSQIESGAPQHCQRRDGEQSSWPNKPAPFRKQRGWTRRPSVNWEVLISTNFCIWLITSNLWPACGRPRTCGPGQSEWSLAPWLAAPDRAILSLDARCCGHNGIFEESCSYLSTIQY